MKIICDYCGNLNEQTIGVKLEGKKLCVRCFACYMVDQMKMPKPSAREINLKRRIEKIEKKLEGTL